jgi:superfamily II DNA/RNA helicase
VIPILKTLITNGRFKSPLPRVGPARPFVLVILPTVELAVQIRDDFLKLGKGIVFYKILILGILVLD